MDEIIPKGIIYNLEDNNHNYSYAHATLQSLCFLYTTNELFSFMELHQMRDNNKYIYKFANEFLNLIEKIKQGITPESKDIIKYFKEIYIVKMSLQKILFIFYIFFCIFFIKKLI